MIDFHSHLIPGVDDGAASADEALAALSVLVEQGVTALVTTPHLNASVTLDPQALTNYLQRIDDAWNIFSVLCRRHYPTLLVARGAEILLDSPHLNVSDSRIRIGDSKFVLVEFPFAGIPPRTDEVLFNIRMSGSIPVVAHPERYQQVCLDLSIVETWRRVGALVQVNSGSFTGQYGRRAEATALKLLARGWIDYISSDYHGRGHCTLKEAYAVVREKSGKETAMVLTHDNAYRMLQNLGPLQIQRFQSRTLLAKIFGRRKS